MFRIIRRKFKQLISKVYDPLVELSIGNKKIHIFMSHQLHENVKIYPDYNYNLPRIIKYATTQLSSVKVIDIGANVGDTVAFIKNYTDVPVLCIDGEEKYIDILKKNVAQYNNVSVCLSLVGAETKDVNVKLKTERGTAFVEESKTINSIRTLENILEEFKDFKDAKILKSDTDGFDTIILRSCRNFLERVKPVLFFEFDPYLIYKNNDDPFQFIQYLKDCGYYYFIFYMNNGDYLLSCTADQQGIIDELIHYFSGREIAIFTDICVFHKEDKALFELSVKEEIQHFKKVRNY